MLNKCLLLETPWDLGLSHIEKDLTLGGTGTGCEKFGSVET